MQIKKIIPLIAALVFAQSALAQDAENAPINNAAHLTALVHSTRAKRSFKTLYLVPGKIEKYYYEWIMPDGTTVTKVESHPLTSEGVADRRPFSESHPNLHAASVVIQTGAAWGPAVGNAVTGR